MSAMLNTLPKRVESVSKAIDQQTIEEYEAGKIVSEHRSAVRAITEIKANSGRTVLYADMMKLRELEAVRKRTEAILSKTDTEQQSSDAVSEKTRKSVLKLLYGYLESRLLHIRFNPLLIGDNTVPVLHTRYAAE